MNSSEVKLPSNKRFGYFFTAIFGAAFAYNYWAGNGAWTNVWGGLALVFALATVVNADVLSSGNKLWMKFGLALGIIVSPLVLGLLFFAIITPVAIWLRLLGRDELQLAVTRKATYWIPRSPNDEAGSFENQF